MTFSKRVTSANLSLFAPLLKRRLASTTHTQGTSAEADDLDSANRDEPLDPERERAETLFAGTSLRVTLPFRRPVSGGMPPRNRPARKGAAKRARATAGGAPTATAGARGALIWEYASVPASSVQRQTGKPTGGMRLVQASFRDARGNRINQTKYFRYDAFGALSWRPARRGRVSKEIAEANFHVILLGQDFGVQTLEISHKPSGEANQNNYTTILHWGGLGGDVRNLNLVGKHVRIYAPASAGSPFTLEVS